MAVGAGVSYCARSLEKPTTPFGRKTSTGGSSAGEVTTIHPMDVFQSEGENRHGTLPIPPLVSFPCGPDGVSISPCRAHSLPCIVRIAHSESLHLVGIYTQRLL